MAKNNKRGVGFDSNCTIVACQYKRQVKDASNKLDIGLQSNQKDKEATFPILIYTKLKLFAEYYSLHPLQLALGLISLKELKQVLLKDVTQVQSHGYLYESSKQLSKVYLTLLKEDPTCFAGFCEIETSFVVCASLNPHTVAQELLGLNGLKPFSSSISKLFIKRGSVYYISDNGEKVTVG